MRQQINVRLEPELIAAVRMRAALLKKAGWSDISVTDVIRVGLKEFIGEGKMNDVYGSKFAAAAIKHVEDEDI